MQSRKKCASVSFMMVVIWSLYFLIISVGSDMTENSFGQFKEGVLAAFGDFNSDELTDIFVITNYSNLQIYLAHDKEPFLRPSSYVCNFTEVQITSVVPGDYDGDAFMDILITTVPLNDNLKDLQDVRIIWGGMPYLNCSDANYLKASTIGQPLAIDYNHDMIIDLFGVDEKNNRIYLIFDRLRSTPVKIPFENAVYKEIKIPHSHSFLDINEDNAADLLITTKFDVEIWLGNELKGFTYDQSIQLPIGHENAIFGQALFLDVALSGQFYLVLPTCFDVECRNSTLLIFDNDNWHDLQVNFNDGKGTMWRLVPPRNESYLDTITIRSGDFNMDGYPDLLLVLSPENTVETHAFLLHNVPCTFDECKFRRTFDVLWDKFTDFGKDVVMATFYDFYMDGVLDIIYVKKNSSHNYTMHACKNDLEYDTNFIKVIVVTGLSNKIVPETIGAWHKRRGTYGTNLPGPRIGYNTWSQEGNYRTGVCAQLSQSANFALQLPYSIFGLDRTPNFVDSLNVGLSGFGRSWTQIIPNSQIVITPSPPNDPSQWRIQLFVTPSKLVLRSVYVLTAIIVLITGCVLYIHWKERNDRHDIIEIDDKTYVRI